MGIVLSLCNNIVNRILMMENEKFMKKVWSHAKMCSKRKFTILFSLKLSLVLKLGRNI